MNDDDVNDDDVFGELVKAIGDDLGDPGHSYPTKTKSWVWEKGQNKVVFDELPEPVPQKFYSAKLYPISPARDWMSVFPSKPKYFVQQASPKTIAAEILGLLGSVA